MLYPILYPRFGSNKAALFRFKAENGAGVKKWQIWGLWSNLGGAWLEL